MVSKVLQMIRTQPVPVAVVAVSLVFLLFAALNQRSTRRVYQWEIESQQSEKAINQFSDLVKPSQRR